MKKFDINKWRREQKALHKKQKIQESKTPIRNKKKLTKEEKSRKKLLTEQVGTSAINWWEDQGFNPGSLSSVTGKLYVCDTSTYTGVTEYILASANGIGSTAGGDAIQLTVWDALIVDPDLLDPYFSNKGAYQEHVNQANGGGGSPTDQYWVTPMDVVHFCLVKGAGEPIGSITCPDMTSPCGGMWVGDANGDPFTPTLTAVGWGSYQTVEGHEIGMNPPVEVFYNKDATGYWNQMNGGGCGWPAPPECSYPVGIQYNTAQYYTAAIIGGTAASNNCQGPSEACDNSWYWFGCDDPQSVNYNELQTGTIDGSAIADTNGTTYIDNTFTTPLSTWYGGITGNQTDAFIWAFDPVTMLWTYGSQTFQSTFYDTNTNIVQGCGVNGIPDSNDDNCCSYLGCQLVPHVPGGSQNTNFPVLNFGIWGWDSNTIVNNNVNKINTYSHVMGCPSALDSMVPDYGEPFSCCKIVGCPNGAKTVRLDSNLGQSAANTPYSWTQLGNLPTEYDSAISAGAQVGCTGIDGNGVWSATDSSCCLPPRTIDTNVGCHDANAINENRHTDTGNPIAGGAAGCLAGSGGVAWTGDSWDSNFVADSSNYSCCNYSACVHDIQYEYPHNGSGTSPYINYGFNGVSNNVFDSNLIPGVPDSNYTMLPEEDGTAGCPHGNGYDILPETSPGIPDISCCTYRANGCPDSSANNFDTQAEGCQGMGVGSSMFANIFDSNLLDSNFAFSTICCNYLSCPNALFDNYGVLNPPSSGYGSLIGVPPEPEYGYNIIGGNPGCDSNNPIDSLTGPASEECCVKYGCMDTLAANYDNQATYPCDTNDTGPGLPGSNGQCCSYGGCHDNSIGVFKHPNLGVDITYHLASNYDPQNSGCSPVFGGLPDSNDYSCCSYYTCQDAKAFNAGYTVDSNNASFFIGAYYSSNYQTQAGSTSCVNRNYDTNNPLTWTTDSNLNWCCVYAGCTDTNARNFDSHQVPNYAGDPGLYYWDCLENLMGLGVNDSNMWQQTYDSSIVSKECCTVEGCSDNTNPYVNNLYTLPQGVANANVWYHQNITCPSGFGNNNIGADPILNYTDYSCCEYTGCVDDDAVNFIEITQGVGGCINDTSGLWDSNDKTCCIFIGCPDTNAINYGTFPYWNQPNISTGQGVTEGTFGCPDSNSTNDSQIVDSQNLCCCQYRLGCTDPNAIAGEPYGNNSYGVNCPSCNYDDEAIGCYTNSTGCMNFPWATEMGNDSMDDGTSHPGPMNLGYGPLVIGIEECCNYQVGCPDSNASIPGVYFLGNLGCPNDTNWWGYDTNDSSCCNYPPVYGCMDAQALNYLASFQGGSPPATHECPKGNRVSDNPFSFLPDTNDPALQEIALINDLYACCDYSTMYSCNDPNAIGVSYGVSGYIPPGYTGDNYGGNFVGRPLTDLFIHPWTGWILDVQNFVAWGNTNGYPGGEINPKTHNPDTPEMWCKEDYNQSGNNYDSLMIIHDYCYDPLISIGCSGYPGQAVPPSNDCCMYDYGCPDSSAINFNYNPSGYAGFRGGLGCYDTNNDIIGPPSSTKTGCCLWDTNTIGCRDPLANNFDPLKEGCTDTNGNNNIAPNENNFVCCTYTYGCADSQADGYVNDSLHLGCEDSAHPNYPQQNPTDYSCCVYTYGCAHTTNATIVQGSPHTWPNFPLVYNNSNPSVIGCEDTSPLWSSYYPWPNPNNYDCCEYNYGCADPINNSYDPTAYGCHDSQNIATGYELPNPNSTVCCGDYNYNCPDPAASNYILNLDPFGTILGCADDPDSNTYRTLASGTAPSSLSSTYCCKYAYGCADTNSDLVTSGTEGPGCNPNGPIGAQVDSFALPIDTNYSCCHYSYGCGDPQASFPNTGDGCNPNNPTVTTAAYGYQPSLSVTDCCMYLYGCTDPDAISSGTLPHYYHEDNMGCHPGSDTNGTAGVPAYRTQITQTNVLYPPTDTNTNCCKYAYNCADFRSTTYDTNQDTNETGALQGCNPNDTSPTALPNFDYPDSSNIDCCLFQYGCKDMTIRPGWVWNNTGIAIANKYKALNSVGWPEWQFSFDQQYYGPWNPHNIVMGHGCDPSSPYSPLTDPLGIGSTPPDSQNFNCCDYGCDNLFNAPTQQWWPGNINTSIPQANHNQTLHNAGGILQWQSAAYEWAWTTYWPTFPNGISFFGANYGVDDIIINGIPGQVCCVDTEASGYIPGDLSSYTLVYPNEACDCVQMGTDLVPTNPTRYMQVDCDLSFPICNICCINKTLATASMILESWHKPGPDQRTPGSYNGNDLLLATMGQLGMGNTSFNASKMDDMITMFTQTPGQMWNGIVGSGTTYGNHIAWYDPNNTSSWGFYLRPPGATMDPTFPCACVAEDGNPHFDIKEIDCYAGFELGCLPPLNPIYAGLTTLPDIDETNFEDYYGCHLQPDYVYIEDCGLAHPLGDSHVFCSNVQSFDEATCTCSWDCPTDFCWCYEPSNDIVVPGIDPNTEWCCADPTTGIIWDIEDVSQIPNASTTNNQGLGSNLPSWATGGKPKPEHYTYIPQDQKYILKDNWKGCPVVDPFYATDWIYTSGVQRFGTTSWGWADDRGIDNTSPPQSVSNGNPIPDHPHMMIVPCDASCSKPYNSFKAPVNVNDTVGFPIAYWTCGCPDIHYTPNVGGDPANGGPLRGMNMRQHSLYQDNGQNSPGWIFPHKWPMDMGAGNWSHDHLGCPSEVGNAAWMNKNWPGGATQPAPVPLVQHSRAMVAKCGTATGDTNCSTHGFPMSMTMNPVSFQQDYAMPVNTHGEYPGVSNKRIGRTDQVDCCLPLYDSNEHNPRTARTIGCNTVGMMGILPVNYDSAANGCDLSMFPNSTLDPSNPYINHKSWCCDWNWPGQAGSTYPKPLGCADPIADNYDPAASACPHVMHLNGHTWYLWHNYGVAPSLLGQELTYQEKCAKINQYMAGGGSGMGCYYSNAQIDQIIEFNSIGTGPTIIENPQYGYNDCCDYGSLPACIAQNNPSLMGQSKADEICGWCNIDNTYDPECECCDTYSGQNIYGQYCSGYGYLRAVDQMEPHPCCGGSAQNAPGGSICYDAMSTHNPSNGANNINVPEMNTMPNTAAAAAYHKKIRMMFPDDPGGDLLHHGYTAAGKPTLSIGSSVMNGAKDVNAMGGTGWSTLSFPFEQGSCTPIYLSGPFYNGANSDSFAYACSKPGIKSNLQWKMADPNIDSNIKVLDALEMVKYLQSLNLDDFGLPFDASQCTQMNINNPEVTAALNKELQKAVDSNEVNKAQRVLTYYEELSAFCQEVFTTPVPDYCLELPADSPYLSETSDECIKCAEERSQKLVTQLKGDEPEEIREQEIDRDPENPDNIEPSNIDYCDCCEQVILPLPDTNIDGRDTNIADTNIFVLPPKDPSIIDKPVGSGQEVNLDSNATKIDSNISPSLPTPEEIEYERKTKEYEAKVASLIADGWIEGQVDSMVDDPNEYDVKTLINQDDETVYFKRKKPTSGEVEPLDPQPTPEPTSDEPSVPNVPEPSTSFEIPNIPPPPITQESLKRMVKNAIREIKKDLKNKR